MQSWSSSSLGALAALLIGSFLSFILARVLRSVLGKIAAKTASTTDDYIVNTAVSAVKPIGWLISTTIAWQILPIPKEVDDTGISIIKLFFLVITVRLANKIAIRLVERSALHVDDPAVSTMLKSAGPMVRALIWSLGFVFYLQNIGVQMAALWALLSAGGIGAGLALKEPVQEFFEYITILLDKPFQNGQFINVDNIWATVERVAVRSTRLRSLNGEIIVMSNSLLTKGVISNYAEMESRRLVHRIGVVYSTPYSVMKTIPDVIKRVIDDVENTTYDRCHFVGFGDSSLNIEFVYYITTKEYKKAMKAQQAINLEIMREFEEKNIDFAFPTRTINIAKETDESQ